MIPTRFLIPEVEPGAAASVLVFSSKTSGYLRRLQGYNTCRVMVPPPVFPGPEGMKGGSLAEEESWG